MENLNKNLDDVKQTIEQNIDNAKDEIKLGYNAVEDQGRRQSPQVMVKMEEIQLSGYKRRKLQATAQDEYRNHALLAWMVRKHINHVTCFDPHIKTGFPEIDERMETLIKNASKKENFDISKRHDRNSMLYLFEAMKVLAGDCLWMKLSSGHVQGIESDRICWQQDFPGADAISIISNHGLVLTEAGEVLKYCIANRGPTGVGYVFNQFLDASKAIYDGYFFRYDQVRGVSPLSTAINLCQDLAEAWEWTLMKIKVHALFGIAIKHESSQGLNYNKEGQGTPNPTANTTTIPNKFSPRGGIMTLDLKPGDEVDTIQSTTPSTEFISYSSLMTRITLLALDIPFTMFDSMASSFSAMIADRILYEESAKPKREKNKGVLIQWTDWKIDEWTNPESKLYDEELTGLLVAKKYSVEKLKTAYDWIPGGTPWLDKTKEVDGDTRALAIGADSIPRICKRRGLDAYKLCDENADFLAYAKSKGVTIMIGQPGQSTATNSPPPTEPEPQDATPKNENPANNQEE